MIWRTRGVAKYAGARALTWKAPEKRPEKKGEKEKDGGLREALVRSW
jgi:hypothetical protein